MEAERDPRKTCVDMMTKPGHFDLYTTNDKSQVCQTAAHTWDDLKAQHSSSGGTIPDACAVLTSHIFQAYSFHLQELSDGIIGSLTDKMTKQLQTSSSDYQS